MTKLRPVLVLVIGSPRLRTYSQNKTLLNLWWTYLDALMLTENIMQKAFVRNATINLEERRLPQHVSTQIGPAMPKICAWSVIITGSMSVIRILMSRNPSLPSESISNNMIPKTLTLNYRINGSKVHILNIYWKKLLTIFLFF